MDISVLNGPANLGKSFRTFWCNASRIPFEILGGCKFTEIAKHNAKTKGVYTMIYENLNLYIYIYIYTTLQSIAPRIVCKDSVRKLHGTLDIDNFIVVLRYNT